MTTRTMSQRPPTWAARRCPGRGPTLVLVLGLLASPVAARIGPPGAPHGGTLAAPPAVLFSTYLGGGIADQAWAIAVDAQGNSYLAGYTASTDFPTLNALQPVSGGQGDAFVSKFDPDGALVYSTYLGGSYVDYATAIAVDAQGSAYVTGWTGSSDFPVANALDPTYNGGWDIFVAKLAPDGQALVYSTYLGGTAEENGDAIAVDGDGNAYVAGETESTDFPLANAFQSSLGGSQDAFVTKLSAAGDAIVYSTYLGGAFGGETGQGIAVDAAGEAHVTGWTTAGDFPTANAYQESLHGIWDVFVTKLASAGNALVYSTFLGGADEEYVDQGRAIALDSSDAAYVTGFTGSFFFPVLNAYQFNYGGQVDAFVAKFGAGGQLLFSTYLGGVNSDVGNGIALDGARNIVVAGLTLSEDFPVVAAIQPTMAGFEDLFVTKFRSDALALDYSTYYGGALAGREEYGATGVGLDAGGNVYLASQASTLDFPLVNPWQPSNHGSYDAIVVKLSGPLFLDGFEAGDTAAWSATVGGP